MLGSDWLQHSIDITKRAITQFKSLVPTPYRFVFLFVLLRPKSTAMVMAGQSVHLTILFPGQA